MFETMSGFLWFFIPTLLLIFGGIVFEEKLICVEQKVFGFMKKVWCKVCESGTKI